MRTIQHQIYYNSSNEKTNYSFEMNEVEQIFENIRNILSRIKNNVPLNREKGIDSRAIDTPIFIARAILTQEILEQIEIEEPRFIVSELNYKGNYEFGKLEVYVGGVIKL